MALELSRRAGPKAKVLVDTGHHLQGTNIEQIVTWLLHCDALGGFHFNDRKYADDDLTIGSIDPYQVFRIFSEILNCPDAKATGAIAYMIDQSHNLKGKIEAMIQTVCIAQELYARAALVDHERLAKLQQDCSLVDAEETLRGAFWQDVRPAIREWRKTRRLPEDPMQAFRSSGYLERVTRERAEKNIGATASYA
jgi:L-rhamnose isomerase/sugar isomerase